MARLHLGGGGALQTAHDLAQHASITLQQACNGMHIKYPSALTVQARVMYMSGEAEAALSYQLKALAYFQQLTGFDSAQVINCHEHLGVYFAQAGMYDRALSHMQAFCYLLELTSGPNHPEVAAGYHRMGRSYQEVGHVIMALRCYQEALEREPGDHLLHPRVQHNVAETLELIGGFKDALKHERIAYAGYKSVYGENDPRVTKCNENIRLLTTKAVAVARKEAESSSAAAAAASAAAQATAAAAAAAMKAVKEKEGMNKARAPESAPPTASEKEKSPATQPMVNKTGKKKNRK
ncbi:unnamed protein product [Choristocarpus tenellus]